MRVTRWRINGYKSFAPIEGSQHEVESSDTELEVGQFSVLIGKNNTGKSNLLASFQDYPNVFGHRNTAHWYNDSVFNQSTSLEINYRIEFALNSDEQDKLLSDLHENKSLPEKIVEASLEEGYFNKVRHAFSIQSNHILNEELETNFQGDWLLISSGEDIPLKSPPSNYEQIRFEGLPTVQQRNMSTDRRGVGAIFPDPFWRMIRQDIRSWEAIEAFREPQNEQTAGKAEDLEPNGKNLVQIVNTLYNNSRELFDQFRDRYVSIMEGITDISTPYVGSHDITIRIHEGENAYDLNEVSAGSKEILTLIAGIVNSQNDTSLLLIEEPELHVHPGAEQEIFDLIQDICQEEDIQVIVSTHSEVFVDHSSASNIARIEREESSSIRSVSEGEIPEELADLGYSKSGLLQSNAVVFVEGRSDKRILTEFCRTVGLDSDERGIAFVELEGKENLKRDGRSLVKLLYSFDIPYLFVVDSDEKTPEEATGELLDSINRSDGEGWWETSPDRFHAWEEYSIESYLLDANAVARGQEFDMDSEDVQELITSMDDIADKTRVLEEVYQEEHGLEDETAYSKDRDGMYIAKRMKKGEIAGEAKEVVRKIGGLVGADFETE